MKQRFLLGDSRITVEVDAPSRGESIHLLSGIREFLHSSCEGIFWDETEVSSDGDVQPEIYSIWERISATMFELQNLLDLAEIDRDLVEISVDIRGIASDLLKTLKDPDYELKLPTDCLESSTDCNLSDCGDNCFCKERTDFCQQVPDAPCTTPGQCYQKLEKPDCCKNELENSAEERVPAQKNTGRSFLVRTVREKFNLP